MFDCTLLVGWLDGLFVTQIKRNIQVPDSKNENFQFFKFTPKCFTRGTTISNGDYLCSKTGVKIRQG